MKRLVLSIFLLGTFSLPSFATTSATARSKVSLQLGSVTVWVGMPQSDALSAFRRAGYEVANKSDANQILIKDGTALYSVNFKDAAVVYADREWLLSRKNEINAVMGALGAIAPRGSEPCIVRHAPVNNPSLQSDRIFVKCGQRSVLIMKDRQPSTDSVLTDVYEYIGSFQ